MGHEVMVQHREAALVVAKRLCVGLPEIGSVLATAFGEVYTSVEAHGGDPDGPPFVIYHGLPDGDAAFDIEICAPVQRAVEPPVGWNLAELPAGTFATLVHQGPYGSLRTGYDALTSWIGGHDLAVAGPPREVYLSEPETPPERIRTVIEFPVVEVAAAVR